MTLSAPARTQVVWLDWDDYLAWLRGELTQAANAAGEVLDLGAPLAPGQHMAVIGPTGCAKTTHAVGFLGANRRYVLALDPKGEDETLAASGYVRVKSLPKTGWRGLADRLFDRGDQRTWDRIFKRIENGHDARVIVGGGSRTDAEDEALRELMRDAIRFSRHSPGWCLYVDEFELLSSQRMMRLGDMIERMLITARRDLTSVITTFQAPAWVSKHATRQARKAVLYPQSGSMVKSLADEMVWDWRELAAVLDLLPEFHTATIGRGPLSGPIVITKAPKLAAPKPPAGGAAGSPGRNT
jgi:hypothetical protein